MTTEEIRAHLESKQELFEVAIEIHTLRGFHQLSGEEVTIRVFDSGPGRSHIRYSVRATTPDGRFATGNPARSVGEALDKVHWYKLDNPEPE